MEQDDTPCRANKVQTVIAKDMSRIGARIAESRILHGKFFSELDICYIAINDGVDSDKGDNDFTPFRNLFNDFYARDTSRKIRAILTVKANAGEHMGKQPYGYLCDENNAKQWIVDEEAAEVVKRIFALYIAGKGPMQIVRILQADKILTTNTYYTKQSGKALPENPCLWDVNSVSKILARMEYCNFKTDSKSNKLKKRYDNPLDKQKIFRDTHSNC